MEENENNVETESNTAEKLANAEDKTVVVANSKLTKPKEFYSQKLYNELVNISGTTLAISKRILAEKTKESFLPVALIILLAILIALPIAQLIIGVQNLGKCPYNYFIPIW